MNHILGIGRSGLNSTQRKMDAISDDLANANTPGYKRKEVNFKELLLNNISNNEVILSDNVNNVAINAGAKSDVSTVNFQQGTLLSSSETFNMAISGKGFFGVRGNEGNLMLTRNGAFHVNEDGSITDDSGYPLDLNIEVDYSQWPTSGISISNSGRITVTEGGGEITLGNIILYAPENNDTLTSLGEGRYMPSENVSLYNSQTDPEIFGTITQNMLEASNVDMAKSLVEMITTQRTYEMNSRIVSSTDQIMSLINNIKE